MPDQASPKPKGRVVIVRSLWDATTRWQTTSRIARRLLAAGVSAALVAGGLGVPAPVAAASMTFHVTTAAMCGGAGTFEQAVKDANASPGTDTIVFDAPGMTVYASSCYGRLAGFDYGVNATESVNIEANGATFYGGLQWLTPSGSVNDPNICPDALGAPATHWVQFTTGFMLVGEWGANNSNVKVTVTGAHFDGLTSLAETTGGASLSLIDSTANKTIDFLASCNRPALFAMDGGTISLINTRIERSVLPKADSVSALIEASNATVILDRAWLGANSDGMAVRASGGSVTIVNSQILNSGGLWFDTDATIVNSAFFSDGDQPTDRVITVGGTTTIKASTFYWSNPVCPTCSPEGVGFRTAPGAKFAFETSAIGASRVPDTYGPPMTGPLLPTSAANVTADALTWVQPTANQDAAALHALVPQAMTAAPGLIDNPNPVDTFYVDALTPLLGSGATPGVLLDAVTGAQCPGGANALLNPIDNSCITEDVFGHARWDIANSKRNIGAVQNVQAPFLDATNAGDHHVGLAWNRPSDPPSGAVTGYTVGYRIRGSADPLTTVAVASPATLTASIGGLTNGTAYEFVVWAVNAVGDGPQSNLAYARPLGPITAPTVTAEPGDGKIPLKWTASALGGHPGPGQYLVSYRKVGAAIWTPWGKVAGLAQTVAGLVNGQAYEFAVQGVAADGATGPTGTTTATPHATPTLSYPQPVTWTKNNALTLPATVGNLIGTPTFQEAAPGLLPNGMTLNTTTGAIEGTPTAAGTFGPFDIDVLDGSTDLFGTGSVTITVLDTAPNPYLAYPDLTATVGIGPVTSSPFLSAPLSVGKTLTYSVVDGPLPGGLGIDPATGVISGTPTTPTGGVASFTMKVCWDTCDPNDNNVVQGVFDVIVLPTLSYPVEANGVAGHVIGTVTPAVTPWTHGPTSGTFMLMPGSVLPDGLSFNTDTGVISGTPTTAGPGVRVDIGFTTGLADPMAPTEVIATLLVNVRPSIITLAYPTTIHGVIGVAVHVVPNVSGAIGPKVFTVGPGVLPPGLSLNPATGVISGMPAITGAWDVRVEVQDAFGSGSDTSRVTIFDVPPPAPTPHATLPPTDTLTTSGAPGGDAGMGLLLLVFAGLLAGVCLPLSRRRSLR